MRFIRKEFTYHFPFPIPIWTTPSKVNLPSFPIKRRGKGKITKY